MVHGNIDSRRLPLFILSCERSGSTLLRCIIDTHPDICSSAQLDLGKLCDGLFNAAYYSIGQLPNVMGEKERERIAIGEARRTVEQLMVRYVRGKGKQRWCEKTTSNIEYLPILDKIFPEALFICLYRNCMDVVHSCIKFNPLGFMPELAPYVSGNPRNFVAAMIESWLEKNRKLLAFEAANPARCFRVTYESLVAKPGAVLSSMFGFLDAEWDESILKSVFTVHHDQGEGDLKVWLSETIRRDSIGMGTVIPSTLIPDRLMADIDALHRELGYPSVKNYYASARPGTRPASPQDDAASGISRFLKHDLAGILARKREDFKTLRGSCKFLVEGVEDGAWIVDFSGSEASLRAVREHREHDTGCSITLSGATLRGILNGEKTALEAYEQGEIAAGGDLGLAIQFGRLLLG